MNTDANPFAEHLLVSITSRSRRTVVSVRRQSRVFMAVLLHSASTEASPLVWSAGILCTTFLPPRRFARVADPPAFRSSQLSEQRLGHGAPHCPAGFGRDCHLLQWRQRKFVLQLAPPHCNNLGFPLSSSSKVRGAWHDWEARGRARRRTLLRRSEGGVEAWCDQQVRHKEFAKCGVPEERDVGQTAATAKALNACSRSWRRPRAMT